MATTVVALFDTVRQAERAVRDLRDHGIMDRDISLMAADAAGNYARDLGTTGTERRMQGDGEGASTGAGIGAALGGLGGLLVGLGVLTIPGVGPILAAGPLSTALAGLLGAGAGALAGGVAGGLIGALVDAGVPEQEAEYYAEGVRRGGTLVAVHAAEGREDEVRDVLRRHDPVDIERRAAAWRESGWQGYDAKAEPYTVDQMEAERQRYAGAGMGAGMGARTMDDAGRGPGYDAGRVASADYDRYGPAFRGHYQSHLAQSGYQYEHYEPAYQYGLTLGNYEPYRGMDWGQIEPEARHAWEERNPNTWERVADAVRYGWERVKQAVRD
jgi:hypothetical protein